jgi:Zn-dependent protease with chaperone function
MVDELFSGKDSLRVAGETRLFWTCILAAPLTIALVSLVFPSVSFSEFVLLIVGGMVFVSIARGRLLGSSIRIDGRQLPDLDLLAREVSARLGVATPQIFVRDDPFVPIAAVGTGEPYALIISSQYYEHVRRGELAFLIARELAHIAAGHTRLTSLLSASGRENPVVALVFGAWLRRTEYTADRVGLLCCDGIADAMGAISISTFHAIGRRVDMAVIAEQRRELEAEPALRMGEWIASVPYATNRLQALFAFHPSPLARRWRDRFATEQAVPVISREAVPERVTKRDCAPLGRRLAALAIDFSTIAAIIKTPLGEQVSQSAKISKSDLHDLPAWLQSILSHTAITFSTGSFVTAFVFFAYSAVLVGVSGQTLGMMVMELRVVTTRFARPTPLQSLWRYVAALMSALFTIAAIGFFVRVHPHDRVSRTRLVRARKAS